ncbi:MAG: hypothetical protein SFX73_18405 [Kofleriaceae bacterium]|nr:hypothetical protein [Kofleriaceae bacterium]
MTRALLAASVVLAGCGGSESPPCTPNLEPDGVYPGYDYCASARYPDFTDPTRRWDGTYPEGCAGVTGEDAFACGEQLFWQALQFDHGERAASFAAMKTLVAQEAAAGTLDVRRRSRLTFRAGQLGVALVAENGDLSPGPIVQRYFEDAVELDPDDDVITEAWLYTVKINGALVLGQDPEQYLDGLWALYERDRPAVAGTVMVVAASMPLDSGWPDIAVDLVENIDLADCSAWCGWELHRAPFALPGQYFSYAEVEARAGRRERAREFLELTRATPRYADWPLRAEADAALADVDAFIGKFASRGSSENVADLMVSGSKHACTVCHAP